MAKYAVDTGGTLMKKSELLKVLAEYDDDQEIVVEAVDGGFDDPVMYITAIRGREGKEFTDGFSSEYLPATRSSGLGAVVLGTSLGFIRIS